MRKFLGRAILGLAILSSISAACRAQEWPSKPVKLIIPFAVGGHSDQVARGISGALQEEWKQPVIVDAKPGGGTAIATGTVAKSAPDGYTLYLANSCGLTQAVSLNPSLGYDPIKDFTPISTVDVGYTILVRRPGLNVNSVAELIALAKSKPGSLTYASSGTGGPVHIGTEEFIRRAGINVLHVPYTGTSPAIVALLGDQVDFMFLDTSGVPHVTSGKVKALGVASPKAWASLPGVVPLGDQGFQGFTLGCTDIVVAPAGTSRAIVDKVQQTLAKVMQRPQIVSYFATSDSPIGVSTPEDARDLIATEYQKNGKMIRDLGLVQGTAK